MRWWPPASPAAARARSAIFSDQLQFHHLAEDQLIWPPARAKLARTDTEGLALLDEMEGEHAQINPLLAAVDGALATDAGHARPAVPLARLRTTTASHLAPDEADSLPLLSQFMTRAGIAAIFTEFGRTCGLKRGAVMSHGRHPRPARTPEPRWSATSRPPPGCSTGPSGSPATAAAPRRYNHRTRRDSSPTAGGTDGDEGGPAGTARGRQRWRLQIRGPVRTNDTDTTTTTCRPATSRAPTMSPGRQAQPGTRP